MAAQRLVMAASPVPNSSCLYMVGVWLFMEAHRRVFSGGFGQLPKPLERDAWDQGGYCLDAPEYLPAGACEYFEVEPGLGLPSQIQIVRGGIR